MAACCIKDTLNPPQIAQIFAEQHDKSALVCEICGKPTSYLTPFVTTAAMAGEVAGVGASRTMGDAAALAAMAHGEHDAGGYNTFCYDGVFYCNDALGYDTPLFFCAGDIFHERRGVAAEAFFAKTHRKQPA